MNWTDRPPIEGLWCLVRTEKGIHLCGTYKNGYWQFTDGGEIRNVTHWIAYPDTDPMYYDEDNLADALPLEIKHRNMIFEWKNQEKKYKQRIVELEEKRSQYKKAMEELKEKVKEDRDYAKRMEEYTSTIRELSKEVMKLQNTIASIKHENTLLKIQTI